MNTPPNHIENCHTLKQKSGYQIPLSNPGLRRVCIMNAKFKLLPEELIRIVMQYARREYPYMRELKIYFHSKNIENKNRIRKCPQRGGWRDSFVEEIKNQIDEWINYKMERDGVGWHIGEQIYQSPSFVDYLKDSQSCYPILLYQKRYYYCCPGLLS